MLALEIEFPLYKFPRSNYSIFSSGVNAFTSLNSQRYIFFSGQQGYSVHSFMMDGKEHFEYKTST